MAPSLISMLEALAGQTGGVLDAGPIHVTKEAFESGGYGVAAVVFVVAVAAVSYLFKSLITAKDACTTAEKDGAKALKALAETLDKTHTEAMEKLRLAKDAQISELTKATVDMVARQTTVIVEVSTQLQRMERLHSLGPGPRGANT